jgi:hypothetical protein
MRWTLLGMGPGDSQVTERHIGRKEGKKVRKIKEEQRECNYAEDACFLGRCAL